MALEIRWNERKAKEKKSCDAEIVVPMVMTIMMIMLMER